MAMRYDKVRDVGDAWLKMEGKRLCENTNYSASQLASKKKLDLIKPGKLIRTCRLLTTVD